MVGRGLGNYIRAFFDFNQVSVQPDEMCRGIELVRNWEMKEKSPNPLFFFPVSAVFLT